MKQDIWRKGQNKRVEERTHSSTKHNPSITSSTQQRPEGGFCSEQGCGSTQTKGGGHHCTGRVNESSNKQQHRHQQTVNQRRPSSNNIEKKQVTDVRRNNNGPSHDRVTTAKNSREPHAAVHSTSNLIAQARSNPREWVRATVLRSGVWNSACKTTMFEAGPTMAWKTSFQPNRGARYTRHPRRYLGTGEGRPSVLRLSIVINRGRTEVNRSASSDTRRKRGKKTG